MEDDTKEKKPSVEVENSGYAEVAQEILNSNDNIIILNDSHVNSHPQEQAKNIIKALVENADFDPQKFVFMTEALYTTARPSEGDLSGRVIDYDNWAEPHKTAYQDLIQYALDQGFEVRGIDMEESVDQAGEERMKHWTAAINGAPKDKRVILQVGAGHLWNDPNNESDILHRLDANSVMSITKEDSYIPKNGLIDSKVIPIQDAKNNIKIARLQTAKS